MITIVLATRNKGKAEEIRALFADYPIEIKSAGEFYGVPEIEESGETLEENALLKARTVHKILNLPTLADDTGLEVFALNNEPGVRSARFAGEHVTYAENNRKLIEL